jgi:hypothetical protein
MMTLYRWTVIGAMTGILVLTGCTHGQRDEVGETADDVAEETGEMTEQVAEETREAADAAEDALDFETTTEINALAGSAIRGNADLSYDDDTARIEVELEGSNDTSAHSAMLHRGTCASLGAMVVHLNAFAAEGSGMESVTTFPTSQLAEGEIYLVAVHGPDGAVVACGEFDPIDRN